MTNQKTERIHSLDALRAIMMLLGLVIHSSISYGKIDFNPIWPIKDPFNTNLFFDMLVDFIHVFRMPVFFVIAGFFGSLIFYYRGPKKMILNRVKRIILPFIIALLFLWPLTLFLGTYTKSQITGNPNSFVYAANSLINGSIIPINTIHLWFLYYLIYFSVSGWVLALLLKRLQGLCDIIKNCFEVIHRHALIKYLSLSIITFACFFVMNLPVAVTSTSLIPHLPSFTLYMIFYLYGWLLFKSKHLLNSFMNKAWLLFAFAVLLFTLKIILYGKSNNSIVLYIIMALNAITIWLFIFSMAGLFLRYKSNYSASMRYISDASYWVYLIHLPIIIFFTGFLVRINISPFLKSFIVFSLTSILCFISYHFFVRSTLISKFLNGRRYPTGKLLSQSGNNRKL